MRTSDKVSPLPDLGQVVQWAEGDMPHHECIVLFFEVWWRMDKQPAMAEYGLLYKILKELLPKVEWPDSEFKWWVNKYDSALITKHETFKRLYLDRFGKFFDAAEYVCSYEEGKGKLYIKKAEIKSVCAAAREQGAPINGGDRKSKNQIDNSQTENKGGNDPVYLARRVLAADPMVFERLERGEFRSVRAAAIDVGVVKDKTKSQLDTAKSVWLKLNDEERNEFLSWVSEV